MCVCVCVYFGHNHVVIKGLSAARSPGLSSYDFSLWRTTRQNVHHNNPGVLAEF